MLPQSLADIFCSVRHSPNKFGIAPTLCKNLVCVLAGDLANRPALHEQLKK
jgi:hypothetical protein